MRCLASLLVLLLAVPMPAQNAAQQQPIATLHAGTQLVVVDVVVQDKNGNPVHGLKASDFALTENGAAQTFKNFEEHSSSDAGVGSIPKAPPMPPGTYTNFTPAPNGRGPLEVLLLDSLNTPQIEQAFVQQQVNKYLASAPAGRRVAIFGLGTRLYLLQGFTDTPEILREAVTKKGGMQSSPALSDPTNGAKLSDAVREQTAEITGNADAADSDEIANTMALFEKEMETTQKVDQGKISLDALNTLARYLATFPGRKNLIWFSGSFPINILPNNDTNMTAAASGHANTSLSGDPFVGTASLEREFRETTALLSRDQVAVYPIQAHGLQTTPMFQAQTATGSKDLRPGGTAMRQELSAFDQKNFDENATMGEMARDTGGQVFKNNNDLTMGIEKAINEGSNYYTIAYSPTDQNWTGSFRSINVKLQDSGYSLSYRRGYFSDNPFVPTSQAGAAPGASAAMRTALVYGGPNVGEVLFTTRVLPASTATEDAAAPGNNVAKTLKGPYLRFNVDASVNPKGMTFSKNGETWHDTVEFLAFLYDSDGKLVNTA